jgi:hypothetical protein
MKISRARKQQHAFWRSQTCHRVAWEKESTDYQRLMNLERGHAAGWIAGVAWARRNQTAKSSNDQALPHGGAQETPK